MDTIVIGAGVAGLACAGELVRGGRRVVVLEKSRGVGGRCATRRVEGQPVDHGVPFIHGDDPEFVAAVQESVPDEDRLDGWPRRIEGEGKPCMRRAFARGEWRAALRDGVNAFAKRLARDVDVRRETLVETIERPGDGWVVRDRSGGERRSRDLVVAVPAPQAAALLDGVGRHDDAVRGAIRLLAMVGTRRCLTAIADYGDRAPEPVVDLWLPGDGGAVHQIVHDSAKRAPGARRILVVQALSAWSARRWDDDASSWSADLLAEASRHVGDWARRPAAIDVQRWRYARADGASEYRRPVLLGSPGVPRLGLIGEVFSPGGGLQGAWRSGRALARRMIDEDN